MIKSDACRLPLEDGGECKLQYRQHILKNKNHIEINTISDVNADVK